MKIVFDEKQLEKILAVITKLQQEWKRFNDILDRFSKIFTGGGEKK